MDILEAGHIFDVAKLGNGGVVSGLLEDVKGRGEVVIKGEDFPEDAGIKISKRKEVSVLVLGTGLAGGQLSRLYRTRIHVGLSCEQKRKITCPTTPLARGSQTEHQSDPQRTARRI